MSSSNFNRSPFCWRDHMHTSFFFWLFSFIDTLQNQIRTVRSFYCDHFQLKLVSYDHSWERKFTNFTFKFIEIVGFYNPNNLLFHLTINPLFKTLNMNKPTISFTFTWRNQKVILFIILTKTYFAWSLHSLSCLKYSIKLSQKYIFQNLFILMLWQSTDFNDFKFHSTNFYYISRF